MLPNIKTVKISGLQLAAKHAVPVARCPPRFSEEAWDYNNKVKFRMTHDQEKLSERIIADTQRLVEETKDANTSWLREVEHHMKERTDEITFLVDELNRQKKTALLEDEALTTYRNRVLNAISFLKDKSLAICKQCLILRENRIGVDQCDDEVDRCLRRELKVIKGCQGVMDVALKETEHQMRKLRAAMYQLDADLYSKDKALKIDEHNIKLKDYQHNLGEGLDLSKNFCRYSLAEWQKKTFANLESNSKELVSAGQLRAYIDLLLKQVCEDMRNQTERTNEAFERRLAETKSVKHALEEKHKSTMEHIQQMQHNMVDLEKALMSKRRAITLCQTRLSNRTERPGLELTCDMVQDSLMAELQSLKSAVCQLNHKLNENKASLRYMMHIQILQEQEINIKANTIKIDEVDCMTLREALKYQTF